MVSPAQHADWKQGEINNVTLSKVKMPSKTYEAVLHSVSFKFNLIINKNLEN